MPSIRQAVEQAVEEDFVLQDALARQVANRRGMARWILEHTDVESTIDHVASILKKYEGKQPPSSLEEAWSAIRRLDVSLEGDMAALVVHKRAATTRKLRSAISHVQIERGGILRCSPARTTLTLIFKESDGPFLRDLFKEHIQASYQGVSELVLQGPEDAIGTPGILALVSSALATKDIPILFPSPGWPDLHLLIAAEDAEKAFETLHELTTS